MYRNRVVCHWVVQWHIPDQRALAGNLPPVSWMWALSNALGAQSPTHVIVPGYRIAEMKAAGAGNPWTRSLISISV